MEYVHTVLIYRSIDGSHRWGSMQKTVKPGMHFRRRLGPCIHKRVTSATPLPCSLSRYKDIYTPFVLEKKSNSIDKSRQIVEILYLFSTKLIREVSIIKIHNTIYAIYHNKVIYFGTEELQAWIHAQSERRKGDWRLINVVGCGTSYSCIQEHGVQCSLSFCKTVKILGHLHTCTVINYYIRPKILVALSFCL